MNVKKPAAIIAGFIQHIHKSYAIDARSLAVFRIAVGFVVLIDLIRRLQHAAVLYSDAGILTRRDAISGISPSRWSLLFINGSPEFVQGFLIMGILAALALIVGWRTRWAAVILWAIVISVQVRNVGVNDGSDNLIRVTLFWAMFLPLAKKWSLDARNNPVSGQERAAIAGPVATVATFGLILQQAYMYWFTAMLKDGPRWTEDGTALYYALGMNHVNNRAGEWIFQHAPEGLLVAITYGTLVLEYAVPILLLLPVRSGMLRTLGVGLIFVLHLGILSTMNVELFPLISMASALGVLPVYFWETVMPRVAAWLNIVLKGRSISWQPTAAATSASASTLSSTRKPDPASLHFRAQIPRVSFSGSMLMNVVCAFAIVLISLSNISNVSSYAMPDPLRSITLSAGLQQSWRMFAPQPGGSSIWYVVDGELASGEKIDLLGPIVEGDTSLRQPSVWDQSDDVLYPTKFWRKYFTSIRNSETPKLRFAQYACRTWNDANSGEDRLVSVRLVRATALTLPDSERREPVYTDLGSWDCR